MFEYKFALPALCKPYFRHYMDVVGCFFSSFICLCVGSAFTYIVIIIIQFVILV